MKNVYNDPGYANVKAELHDRLDKLMEKYGDSYKLAKSFIPAEPDSSNYRQRD
ncbi:MAG: hypothetical protein JXR31_03400 [Prolixibacteraceae bacterium]|nr:hypothetical protein [Prolixibacteraceae bacterium]MBN2773269.1 hypothetical protein [Prolixibacteraceae bacterium]